MINFQAERSLPRNDRSAHEMRVLCGDMYVVGTSDHMNLGGVMIEVLARRLASIADALSVLVRFAGRMPDTAKGRGGTRPSQLTPMTVEIQMWTRNCRGSWEETKTGAAGVSGLRLTKLYSLL